jgi:sulfate permease, SulP family
VRDWLTSSIGASRVAARRLPVLGGIRPIVASRVPVDVLAGLTLAALGIPEVLGYAAIAGMPVVTGLYTLLLPMAVFAVLGSSRHLVVGADSATAAIVAAGVAGLATAGTHRYVQLVGLAALLTGCMLLLARIVRLGFLADFLSRTVLIGFLTGVGVSIALGQLPDLLGVQVRHGRALPTLVGSLEKLPHASSATVAVASAVLLIVVAVRLLNRRIPGALIAVVAATTASAVFDLPARGVAVLGHVEGGLPSLSAPALSLSDAGALLATAGSMFVVVLAQSSATSRAYAARYDESFDEGTDLVGLAAANAAAAFSGTFVVNGSPTKTQMVDSAGGRSQLSMLTCSAAVLVVLLALTDPLAHLPRAVLAAVVFLIGIELVDLKGIRRTLRLRPAEFVVAMLTAAGVIVLGVEQGIAFAIVASMVDHLRHSYNPATSVLVRGPDDHWRVIPPEPDARTDGALLIYRFPSNPYYANVHRLAADVAAFVAAPAPLGVFCLDSVGIVDVDLTAADTLRQLVERLAVHRTRFVLSSVSDPVRAQLSRYGLLEPLGAQALYPTPGAVLEAFQAGTLMQLPD